LSPCEFRARTNTGNSWAGLAEILAYRPPEEPPDEPPLLPDEPEPLLLPDEPELLLPDEPEPLLLSS
jgi:hypothetical protein